MKFSPFGALNSRMKKLIPAFTIILFSSIFLFAQDTPDDTEDVVKITTTLIQLDVTVTDSKGNPVKDIKPEEIEIYENGEKQKISNFSFISGAAEKPAEPADKPEKNNLPVLPTTTVRPEQVRRTIALVVDDLTLSFQSVYYVRSALKKFVDEQMQDGDLVAIIRTGAGIGALQQFTSDKRMLYAAIEKVRWNPAGYGGTGVFAPVQASIEDSLNREENSDELSESQKNRSDENNDDESSQSSDIENFRESVFATGTLGAINYVVRGMQELPGRKSVMLFSDGFKLIAKTSDGFIESSRIMDSLTKLIDAANRASVVIYTMDARGLVTTGLTAEDDLRGKSAEQIRQIVSGRGAKLFDTQDGLRYLAKQTGGISIINNNDLNGGIRRMLNDQSYYLVGYEPDEEVFDPRKRRFNTIEVKVKRKDVRVRYRSGFFGVSDDEIAKLPKSNLTPTQRIMNALTSPFANNELPLRLNAIFGNELKQGSFIRSFLHINTDNIKFTEMPDGKKKAVFDILGVAFGDNGVLVDNISKRFTATVDEETYKLVKEKGFIYDFIFPIKKAGAYQLRVAVYDTASEKVGSASQFVEAADINKKRLMLSGVVVSNLTFKDWQNIIDGKAPEKSIDPISDTAIRQFKKGTVLNYGAAVYNPKTGAAGQPDLTSQIKLFKDGKAIYEGKIQPISLNNAKDVQRVSANGSLNLGAQMEPGEYVLQVIVTDNLAKKKRQTVTQFVPFEIIK